MTMCDCRSSEIRLPCTFTSKRRVGSGTGEVFPWCSRTEPSFYPFRSYVGVRGMAFPVMEPG